SQTAWALMGLIAASQPAGPSALDRRCIRRGLDYLISTQASDGSWPEPQTTGTGFPSVFYLRYDMYRNNWPLLALATFKNYREGTFHAPNYFQSPKRELPMEDPASRAVLIKRSNDAQALKG
ncbi:MAG: squalene-hopene cyclase, partial [Chthoniobacteraceae bacterium]|nr:squalene-hopene cyclase [Chthoniobacteraceae bacterium]